MNEREASIRQQAEGMILGVSIRMGAESPGLIADLVARLSPEDFAQPTNRQIFVTIRDLFASKTTIDLLTVIDGCKTKEVSSAYVSQLIDGVPYYTQAKYLTPHINILKDATARRQLAAIANWVEVELEAIDLTAEDVALEAQRKLGALPILNATSDVIVSAETAVDRTLRVLQDRWDSGREIVGISTGYAPLDRAVSGIRPGAYYCVASASGQGKTTLVLNLVRNVLNSAEREGRQAVGLFLSLEMTLPELMIKLIGIETQINTQDIERGSLSTSQKQAVRQAAERFKRHKISFIEGFGQTTPLHILSFAERVKQTHGQLDFIVLDYIQLADGAPSESEYTRVTETSKALKRLALNHNCAIFVVSQLNRKTESKQDYQLNHLRNSGQIGQDADVVLFINQYDWNMPDHRRRITIAKNRHGQSDIHIPMIFFPDHSRFALYTAAD